MSKEKLSEREALEQIRLLHANRIKDWVGHFEKDVGDVLSCVEAHEQQGGVCEWEQRVDKDADTLSFYSIGGCGPNSLFDTCDDFKYCPYCGRPVSVKEAE